MAFDKQFIRVRYCVNLLNTLFPNQATISLSM
jgi:hypothetical protein